MVEVAKEVAKPDYLSLVNKSGSGFNVSELVDAIVGSEIEPKRNLQKTKQEKTENAISGIGFLKSQASTTQTSFTSLKNDTFFGLLIILFKISDFWLELYSSHLSIFDKIS